MTMVCGREQDAADWKADPEDKVALVSFLHGIRSRIGQGGNWDKTALNKAATFMAQRGPSKKGRPKLLTPSGFQCGRVEPFGVEQPCQVTSNLQALCQQGVAAVRPDQMNEILPTHARGRNVFNPAASTLQGSTQNSQLHPPGSDNDESNGADNGTGSNSADKAATTTTTSPPSPSPIGHSCSASQSVVSQSHIAARMDTTSSRVFMSLPATPRSSSLPTTPVRLLSDEHDTPNSKRYKKSGPDAITMLATSVEGIAGVVRELAPKISSAIPPTKQVAHTRELAKKDTKDSHLIPQQRAGLSILFARNPRNADVYMTEDDAEGRVEIARHLLNGF
ncbi:hypothetical protein GGX14DRAFT_401297 [Mycena pura]|uniref:Uncharacterized protein n=1 Tax=Mycena pura TaxID=153505 RepID=A0AAD6V0Q3_9AGAR|nr:hypothetical protein GGX14DRAFT_401297 [Mycena pura]